MDQLLDDLDRILLFWLVEPAGLIADGIDPAHHATHLLFTPPLRAPHQRVLPPQIGDLLTRFAVVVVDADGADILRFRQALGDPVDDIDLSGAAQIEL